MTDRTTDKGSGPMTKVQSENKKKLVEKRRQNETRLTGVEKDTLTPTEIEKSYPANFFFFFFFFPLLLLGDLTEETERRFWMMRKMIFGKKLLVNQYK